MPLDATPVIPKGLFTLVARLGSVHQDPLAVAVSREHPPPLMFQSHFATCPNADSHRVVDRATSDR